MNLFCYALHVYSSLRSYNLFIIYFKNIAYFFQIFLLFIKKNEEKSNHKINILQRERRFDTCTHVWVSIDDYKFNE